MADADSKGSDARIIVEFRANHGNVASYAGKVVVLSTNLPGTCA